MSMANFSDHLCGIGSGLRWPSTFPSCCSHLHNPLPLNVGRTVNVVKKSLPRLGSIIQPGETHSLDDVILYHCLRQLKRCASSLKEENRLEAERDTWHGTRADLLGFGNTSWPTASKLRKPLSLSPITTRNKTLINNWWTWRRSQASDQTKAQPTPGFQPDETLSRELN